MKRCNTKLLLFAVCLLLGGFLVNGLMGLNSQIASASTDYTVDYVVNSDWGSGASVNVTIKNTGASEINGWKLEWTFSGNQKVISSWNGNLAQTGSAVTVSNMAYNAVIPAKGSVSFGFTLSYSGTNSKPTGFTLNNNVIASPSATPVLTPTPTATPVPSSSSDVLFIGRFDTSDAAGPKFAWSASTIKAKFDGTSISVNLKSAGDNWFNVVIDGVVKTPVNIGPSTAMPVLLASGLASGNHTVELVKRTEAWVGDVQFLGFSVGGGKLLAPPAAAARRIEFIGDSITCGYGNEGASQYQSFTVKNENAYLAYGSIAARTLEADQITVAWSGKGLVHNYGGDTTDLMSQVYSRVLPYNTTLTWDAKKWTPQVVVINLGTNDFSTYPPTTATFTAAYLSFVKKIRNQYSNAHIYCAVGPMLGWDGLLTAKESINAVIAQLKAAGDAKVHFIEFPTQDGTLGYGEDWHPSLATHAQMAEILVERLETDLGW